MFDSLSDKLHGIFKKLRGESRLSEANIAEAMRDIRLALLEADVNAAIADEFIQAVKESCIGQDVLKSVTPGVFYICSSSRSSIPFSESIFSAFSRSSLRITA